MRSAATDLPELHQLLQDTTSYSPNTTTEGPGSKGEYPHAPCAYIYPPLLGGYVLIPLHEVPYYCMYPYSTCYAYALVGYPSVDPTCIVLPYVLPGMQGVDGTTHATTCSA